MSFLLDTNVVCEWVKPRPDAGLVEWLATTDEDRLYLSVVTLAELRDGIERLPEGYRRVRLETWLEHDLVERFDGRVVPITQRIAHTWGRLVARAESAGRTPGVMDGFIAATAMAEGLTVVTRNVGDFASLGLSVTNPWTG